VNEPPLSIVLIGGKTPAATDLVTHDSQCAAVTFDRNPTTGFCWLERDSLGEFLVTPRRQVKNEGDEERGVDREDETDPPRQ